MKNRRVSVKKYGIYLVTAIVSSVLLGFIVGELSDSKLPQNLPEIQVDATGKASASIPIEVPEFRGKMDLSVSLQYTGNGSGGLLAEGWALTGIDRIETITPPSLESEIKYLHTSLGYLHPIGGGRFRTEPDQGVLVRRVGEYFEVRYPTGDIHFMGLDSDSRLSNTQSNLVVWGISKWKDSNGNEINFSYKPGKVGHLVPDTISYGDRVVRFQTRDRSESVIQYPKEAMRTRERDILEAIEIQVAGSLFRKYTFEYVNQPGQRLSKERLVNIGRKDVNRFGTANFYNLSIQYEDPEVPTWKQAITREIQDTYTITRLPYPNKLTCAQGVLVCQQYNALTCTIADAAACLPQKQALGVQCSDFQQKYALPCAHGVPTALSTTSLADIRGTGRPELVRMTGNVDENNLRLKAIGVSGNELRERNVSGIIPPMPGRSFQTMGWGDVNGDGKSDFVYSNGSTLQVMFSNGNTLGNPQNMSNVSVPAPGYNMALDEADNNWRGSLMDVDGDGRADYIRPDGTSKLIIYLSQGTSFSGPKVCVDCNWEKRSRNPHSIQDIDGDGVIDFVKVEKAEITILSFTNDFTQMVAKTMPVSSELTDRATLPRDFDLNHWFTDLNNDGRQDLVALVYKDDTLHLNVYLNTGRIFSLRSSIRPPSGMNYLRLNDLNDGRPFPTKNFVDVNGDGYPDLLVHQNGQLHIHYWNPSEFSFSLKERIPMDAFYTVADFNGDGYADILGHKANDESLLRNNSLLQLGWEHAWWAQPELGPLLEILALLATYQIDQGSEFIYREGNPVRLSPRLTQISDGKSKSVQVTYKDKSHFPNAIQAGTGSYPSLPATFENEFVSQVVTNYGIGITETRNYDYTDVRFRMGRPDRRAHYGARIHTTIHGETGIKVESIQSQDSRLTAGQPIQNRIYTQDGQLVQETQVSYATPILASGLRTSHPVLQTETKYRGGQVVTTKTVSIQYDGQGFPTTTTESVGGKNIITTNTYNHNTAPTEWRLGQATRTTKTAGGILTEDTEYTYDTKGNVISQKQFPYTGYQTTTTLSYDSYGNPVSITDQDGRTTSIEYDTTLYKYPTKITNPLGHVQTKEIDTATGLEIAEIDPNGVITRKYYDGFGRLSGESFPGSSNLDKRYVYAIEDGTGNTAVKVITNDPIHGNISKTEIFDAKGRPKKIETLLPGNVKMVELTEYDTLGRVHRKSAPFVEGLGPIPWTTTEYNPEGEITKLTQPDGTTIQNTYSGLTTTSQMYGPSGALLQTTSLTTDAEENPISRTSNGLTLTYEYDNAGRNTKITDPEGVATLLEYDLAGRRTKQYDKTSGETRFQYNAKGNLIKQTDARGMYITFEYDALDRITKLTPSDGTPPTEYHYDQPAVQSANALGKLTKITGEFGTIEVGYDTKGAENYRVHSIDDIKAYLKTETDSHGRLTSRTLPDGTKLRYDYAPSGHLVRVGMDTSDGNSINHTVAEYAGPIVEGDKFYLERKTGNNVSTKIEFDPLRRRPISMKTTLAEGQTAQHLRYSYDEKGNILEIKDFLREDKNQTFEYDSHNRITKAIGKYGTEEYEYTAGGNLKKRGQFILSYDDPNHKHAVTRATSPNTGVFHYTYDATGNMVSRNGDTLIYDANRKLKEMIKSDGIKYRYKYDQNGLRVKKTSLETGEIVYSLFDGMYEIARRPSKPEAHTVYIRGIKDDLLAQITREDSSLLISEEEGLHEGTKLTAAPFASQTGAGQVETGIASAFLGKVLPFCKDKSVDCGSYLKNASQFYLKKYIAEGIYHPKHEKVRMIIGWGIVLLLLYWLVYSQFSNGSISFGNIYRFVSPLLLTSILFTFTSGCGIFTTGNGQGEAPWLLLGSGINSNTPSVRDDGMVVSGGGTGIPFTVPVTGMYFVHSDHLGSVSFLTNGRGSIIAGGEFGGKSDIQYKPYGEIDRPHSSGPDISKYKFTGQEEDKESGLLYYKARYYDPGLARFLQADEEIFPEQINGLNRSMYAEGNPVKFTDDTGNRLSTPVAYALVGYLTAPEGKEMEGLVQGLAKGLQVHKAEQAYNKARINFLGSLAVVIVAVLVIVVVIIASAILGLISAPLAGKIMKTAGYIATAAAGQAEFHQAEMSGTRLRDKQVYCGVSLFFATTPNTDPNQFSEPFGFGGGPVADHATLKCFEQKQSPTHNKK
jgi:RHS repeat-associated protein